MSFVEVVTTSERLGELADQWTELWDRCPQAGLFQNFDYCLDAWQLVARPAGSRLACLVGWRGDELVAVWPFTISRHRLWNHARPLVASGVELHELLVDDGVDTAAWVREAWQTLTAHARLDVVDVSYFQHSASAAAFEKLPASATDTGETVCVAVGLRSEPDWDAYYGSLSKSYRKDFAKSRRRLEALGALEFEVLEPGDPRMSSLVDWTLTQKRRWAAHTGKQGQWLYSEHYRAFLEHQLGRRGAGATNVLMTLTVDGNLLATQMGALSKNSFEAVIAGFSADYDKFSPGARLTEDMIRWAWERGVDCELGAGAEPYKLFWSRNQKLTITNRRLTVSGWGRVERVLHRVAQQLKRRGS